LIGSIPSSSHSSPYAPRSPPSGLHGATTPLSSLSSARRGSASGAPPSGLGPVRTANRPASSSLSGATPLMRPVAQALPPMRAAPPPGSAYYSRPSSPGPGLRQLHGQGHGLALPSMNSLRLYDAVEGPVQAHVGGGPSRSGLGVGRPRSPGLGNRHSLHALARPASPVMSGGGGGNRMSLSHLTHPQPVSSPASLGGGAGLRRPASPGLGLQRPPSRVGSPGLGLRR